MAWSFETFGNATVEIARDDRPILVTDPWLSGTACFGSWALEIPLSERQIERVLTTPFVWLSHARPDRLHVPSVEQLDRGTEILLPDHYGGEMRDWLAGRGFRTQVLRFKQWTALAPGLRVMCLHTQTLDAVLIVEAGGSLMIDKNDAPLCGEELFLRRLVQRYDRTFLVGACAVDPGMLNTYDADMRPTMGSPQRRKPDVVQAVSRLCDLLGVGYFCRSSAQHVHVRPDSAWANAFRITEADLRRHWCAKRTALIEPFATVDLQSGAWRRDCPAADEPASVPIIAADDDWDEPLSWQDWSALETFVRRFPLLRRRQDFVAFTVAGQRRVVWLRHSAGPNPRDARGVNFIAPRRSLMRAVNAGSFDELLVGNFVKVQLFNMVPSRHPTPLVGKLGGGAQVFTAAQWRRFRRHYFRLSPAAYALYRCQQSALGRVAPMVEQLAATRLSGRDRRGSSPE